MSKLAIAIGVAGTLLSSVTWAEMESENGQINYKIGTDVGKYLKDSELNFDTTTVDLSKFSKGVYFMEIANETDKVVRKILLE